MNWIKKIISQFSKIFQTEYKCFFVEDIPEDIKNKSIYIVGSRSCPWLIIFKCPCGCNSLIQLNLLKDASPCWKFKITNKGKFDISPSIWKKKGCKSHFFVHKNKIRWVSEM